MREYKILQVKNEGGKLIWFSAWIKNDRPDCGYANGYVIIHKDKGVQNAIESDVLGIDKINAIQEITFNQYAKEVLDHKDWVFVVEMIKAHKAKIEDYFIVGFDTYHSYNRHYKRHNVEMSLKDFANALDGFDFKKALIKAKIREAETALKDLKQLLIKN